MLLQSCEPGVFILSADAVAAQLADLRLAEAMAGESRLPRLAVAIRNGVERIEMAERNLNGLSRW